jgi:NAD(P)-dependent dehydrogenase (short-subunit alcohol dehydrogenase family)
MSRFTGKVALVTGATSGIGRDTAVAFAREGAKVVITGRRTEAGRKTIELMRSAGGEGIFVQADVSKEPDVEAVVSQVIGTYGRLDIALNNAGVEGGLGPITSLTEAQWDETININLKGTWLSLKHEIAAMLKTGGGSIINISTIAGIVGMAGASIYGTSKAGVIGLTRCVAIEYAKAGIRVNVVSPGAIQTEMFDRFTGNSDEAKASFAGTHPMGRVGTTDEVSGTVLWLASDAASFITGQNIAVDGGYTAQ